MLISFDRLLVKNPPPLAAPQAGEGIASVASGGSRP
jgi:hypothetical protein